MDPQGWVICTSTVFVVIIASSIFLTPLAMIWTRHKLDTSFRVVLTLLLVSLAWLLYRFLVVADLLLTTMVHSDDIGYER
jgi:hypothetical protein